MGDLEYRRAEYEKALKHYQRALEVDPENEIVFGNIALVYLKLHKFDEALEYCDKQIGKIKKFIRFSNFNPQLPQSSSESKRILVKVYLRKATALKQLNKDQESLETVKEALLYDENNKEGKDLLKELETKANDLQVKKSLEAANELLRNGKINEALDQYADLLKKVNPNEHFDHLSILLNKITCHMHLEQLEDVISIAIRGLKIIRNIKNRAVGFAKISLNKGKKEKLKNSSLFTFFSKKEQSEKLNSFEVRFLVRRGNAYLKQSQ